MTLPWSLTVTVLWVAGYVAYYFGIPWEFYASEGWAYRVDFNLLTLIRWFAAIGTYTVGLCVRRARA